MNIHIVLCKSKERFILPWKVNYFTKVVVFELSVEE